MALKKATATITSEVDLTATDITNIKTPLGITALETSQGVQDTAIGLNTAKITYPATDSTKVGFITVTQAVNLDEMETDIAALANGMVYKGDWDASSGSFPASANIGWFYYVSVGGTVDGIAFNEGDNLIAIVDNASTGTFAGNWSKHDQTDAVQAVVGLTGSITKTALLAALSLEDGASPNFTIANQTLDDTNLVVVPETNLQSFANGVDAALLKARGTGVTTSYVSSVAVGGTTFAQPDVSGEINSDQGYFSIAHTGDTGISVNDLTSASTFVYIDNAGNRQQQTSIPTRQDWSRKMFTMRIGVNTATNLIIGFEYLNNPIGHYANSIRDLYTYLLAQGVPFKIGQTITGRVADLGFDVGAGTLMEFGGTGDINNANIRSYDSVSNTAYNLMSRTALVSSETDLVKFWDNAGTITALGSTTCVAHRVYRFSSGNFAIQYGQGNYANMTLAKAGARLEEYVLNPALEDATFFGWWLLEETATATSGTPDAEFVEYTIGIQGGTSSGLSGCLLKGNNLSDLLDAAAARTNLEVVASTLASEPSGSDKVVNMVSLTQAEYDAGTPVSTTFYAITT
jgi:hypothetical protein